jgi:prepilin-type N-terminal cleavage/methylation domain-containing protein
MMKSEKGTTLIELVAAVALLGILGAAFLGSTGTASKATLVSEHKVIAESLARSEIEYIKAAPYAAAYVINPALDIPDNWAMPEPAVENLHGTDDGIQKVTISVMNGGEEVLSACIYKVNR